MIVAAHPSGSLSHLVHMQDGSFYIADAQGTIVVAEYHADELRSRGYTVLPPLPPATPKKQRKDRGNNSV